MRHGLIGILGPDLTGNNGGQLFGNLICADEQVKRRNARLRKCLGVCRVGVALYVEIADDRDDAANLIPLPMALAAAGQTDAFPQHVESAPAFSGHGFVRSAEDTSE